MTRSGSRTGPVTRRRTLLKAAVAGLAAPGIAAADGSRVIRFVPQTDLAVLDPIVNTNTATRNHAFLVFDTLYGVDERYQVHPQMVAGHTVDSDFRDWTLTLRDGLKFHDGSPVLGRDVVASIRRWSARDGFGQDLMAALDDLSAPTDSSVRFRFRRRFRVLPEALGKFVPTILAIMPERIAAADPTKAVSEIVGSGPFRYIAKERIAGALNVYERFEAYVPRSGGPLGFTSGPKIVTVDRVEWRTIPDQATAAAALRSGEIDWVETPGADMLPVLRRDAKLVVATHDLTGVHPILRFNCLLPPFDNAKLRRAILRAVDQTEFMSAFSNDTTLWRVKSGAFTRGSPMASDAGLDQLFGPTNVERAKREVADAGYRGEKIVFIYAVDHPVDSPLSQVAIDLLRRIGLDVDAVPLDSALIIQRRIKKEPVSQGGWNIFATSVSGMNNLSPADAFLARANGGKAWYGWPTIPRLEELRDAWLDAADDAARKRISDEIQITVFQEAPHVPLGQVLQPTAYRANITGVMNGFPKFWNIRKA